MAGMVELLAGGAAISGTAYLVGSAISYSMYKREKAKSKWLETTGMLALVAVSYTHLDVYKRQGQRSVHLRR